MNFIFRIEVFMNIVCDVVGETQSYYCRSIKPPDLWRQIHLGPFAILEATTREQQAMAAKSAARGVP
jgi:hypothetical protein